MSGEGLLGLDGGGAQVGADGVQGQEEVGVDREWTDGGKRCKQRRQRWT